MDKHKPAWRNLWMAGDWLARSPRLVVGGLILAMVILGLLIARNSLSQSEARSRAQAEGDALLAINRLAMTMLDLETGQRGFILTRDPAYLAPYTAARREVEGQLEEVRLFISTMGSGQDETHLRQMGVVAQSKIAELDRTVSLARVGYFDLALQKVQDSYGKRDMDQLRRHLAVLAARQSARRNEAFARAESVEREQLPLILLMWLLILLFGWATLVSERRRALMSARAEQAEALEEAHGRAKLLTEELNHRVKNLFAVVLSVVNLSGRKQAPAKEVVDDISARIHALMQAHNAALERGGTDAELSAIVERTLEPYRDADCARVAITGADVILSARNVTPVAMILHELATNAAKYGALARPDGHLAISWTSAGGEGGNYVVSLIWREDCGAAVIPAEADHANGFGTRMTSMAAKQLSGTIERNWSPNGIEVLLHFPAR
jgi:two-component sensor histidine kinase/CHASE3 domain sensor protein